MNLTGSKMSIKRGDDNSIVIFLHDNSFVTGDKVFFNLKKREYDTDHVLQILVTSFIDYEDINNVIHPGSAIINIRHEDTENLYCGDYIYNIHIEWQDGTHQTPIGPATFSLLPGADDADMGEEMV